MVFLNDVIVCRNVGERRIGIKVCVCVACGNCGGLVGNDSCVIVTGTAGKDVVVALYCAGIHGHRVLTVDEHIILRENVAICSGVHSVRGLSLVNTVVYMHICLTAERTTGVAVLPVVVMPGNMVLQRGVGGTNKVGLVITLVVAVAHGHIITTLEVAGTVTAVLIGLGRAGDRGSVEGAVMYPATLNGSSKGRALLLTLHADTVLGYVSEAKVSYLKALTVAVSIVGCLADKVKTPTVDSGIMADTLDGDILTTRHTSHKAVVTSGSAVINAVILGKTVDLGGSRAEVSAAGTLNATYNTDNQGSAVSRQLTENILVAVCCTALGVHAAAYVHTGRAKNVTDTCNGCTVLTCYGNSVLVLIGNVENDCIFLKRTVVIVCTYTCGVIKVCIAGTVVLKHLNTALGKCARACVDGQRIRARLESGDVNSHTAGLITHEILKVLTGQAA